MANTTHLEIVALCPSDIDFDMARSCVSAAHLNMVILLIDLVTAIQRISGCLVASTWIHVAWLLSETDQLIQTPSRRVENDSRRESIEAGLATRQD